MKRIRNLTLFLFLFGPAAAAQTVNSLTVKADKEKIVIGEQFNLTIEAVVPATNPIRWLRIDTIPHFEIIAKTKVDSLVRNGTLNLTQKLTLTSWDSGIWAIPAYFLPQLKSVQSAAININVSYAFFNAAQDYNDVKDILEVAKPAKATWYWYLIGAVLLLFLFMLLFPTRKRDKKEVVVSNIDAYKQAVAALEELRTKTGGDSKTFYTGLIDIFRTYSHQRKGLQFYQKTTDEMSRQLKNLNLPSGQFTALIQVLQISDVVKFARFQPTEEENKIALETIRKSIVTLENTKA